MKINEWAQGKLDVAMSPKAAVLSLDTKIDVSVYLYICREVGVEADCVELDLATF